MKCLKYNENGNIYINNDNLNKNNKTVFVFDNINNANPSVMELLTSIFDKNQKYIMSSDGNTFQKNNIQIIGIFNPQNGETKEKLSY